MGTKYLKFVNSPSDVNSGRIRISGTFLEFGALRLSKTNMPPPTIYGRVGDFVFIDNAPSNTYPTAFGIWVKVPFGYDSSSIMNSTNSYINPPIAPGDILVINGIPVTITGNTVDAAVTDINNAAIPSVTAYNIGNSLFVTNNTGDYISIDQNDTATRYGMDSEERPYVSGADGFWVPYGSPILQPSTNTLSVTEVNTTTYTLQATDDLVLIRTTSDTTISLGHPSSYTQGKIYRFKIEKPINVIFRAGSGGTLEFEMDYVIVRSDATTSRGKAVNLFPYVNDWLFL